MSTRVELISVDAVGFEPTASPLQGERSTADLRAPRVSGARRYNFAYLDDPSQEFASTDGLRCLLHSVNALPLDSVQQAKRKVMFRVGGDPSAGSPTDTLLRLNPPCRAQV